MATLRDRSQRDFRLQSESTATKATLDFSKIKVGQSSLNGSLTSSIVSDYLGSTRKRKYDRKDIERAIDNNNVSELRRISEYFALRSGIYGRLCRYMAYLYRYDWFITPHRYDERIKDEKVIEGWMKASTYLDNCKLKRNFGRYALDVIKQGCYYGYIIDEPTAVYLQKLPADYCRSRYEVNGIAAVEFNIKFFDACFTDNIYRLKVLKSFPKEFQKAYIAYKNGSLQKDFNGDEAGWFLLDPSKTVKFNLSGSDAPLFISVIPAILDLEEAKQLDKVKMQQQLLKLIIQKMPIDKNGDLIFDVAEANALHNNVVNMVGDAIGLDVLTTFADVDVADLADKGNASSIDELERVERSLYNEAGVSQKQFNTDGQTALDKSIANDEATMNDLLSQFADYTERLLAPFNKNAKRLKYCVGMLPTTIYNYKDLSKIYKEQTQLGFSKLLPQVALGHSQSDILATAVFENQIMDLNDLFVPPQMSSTMSGNKASTNDNDEKQKTGLPSSDNQGGRPPKPDDEKSEKTLRNIESSG